MSAFQRFSFFLHWWQREEGLIAFQNEVVKSIYYHFKY
jgi:hypothetical protein